MFSGRTSRVEDRRELPAVNVAERRRDGRGRRQRVRDRGALVDTVAVRGDRPGLRARAFERKRGRRGTEETRCGPDLVPRGDRPRVPPRCGRGRIPGPIDSRAAPGPRSDCHPERVGDRDGPGQIVGQRGAELDRPTQPATNGRRVELRKPDCGGLRGNCPQPCVQRVSGTCGRAGIAMAGHRA